MGGLDGRRASRSSRPARSPLVHRLKFHLREEDDEGGHLHAQVAELARYLFVTVGKRSDHLVAFGETVV
jgi:hypothetical protein